MGTTYLIWQRLSLLLALWLAVPMGIRVLEPVLLLTRGSAINSVWPILLFVLIFSWSSATFSLYLDPLFGNDFRRRCQVLLLTLGLACGMMLSLRHFGSSPFWGSLYTANLVLIALSAGNLLLTAVKKPAELVPVCLVMLMADLFSVFAGPSKSIAAEIQSFYLNGQAGPVPWSDFLLVKIAVPGNSSLVPICGVSDLIILSFLISAARKFQFTDNLFEVFSGRWRFGKKRLPFLPFSACGLLLALFAARWSGVFLPALPIIALVFLGVHLPRQPRMRMLQKTEWFVVLISCGVLVSMALFGILTI